jgi:uncharacterized 2Fe-2S/4Fe-4S cluster protein (DUF4445 family)
MEKEIKVTFKPEGRSIFVLPGTPVIEAAGRAGIALETPCGGQGTCGKCRVELTRGELEPTPGERKILSGEELASGIRLACQARIFREVVIHVPESSLFSSTQRILTVHDEEKTEVLPGVQKRYVELPSPTLQDQTADAQRLERFLEEDLSYEIELLRELPEKFRQQDFKGTVVLAGKRMIAFEKGDTTTDCFGVAFDLGTTTMVGTLLDLCTGEERAMTTRLNPQAVYGDDVLSRINFARNSEKNLRTLQLQVVKEMNAMIQQLGKEAGAPPEQIYEVAVAGNTTMQHLFCGVNPSSLGEIPFVPAFTRGQMIEAREVGLKINPGGWVYVFPNIGGFVGGDTVSAILATGLDRTDEIKMIIDIGTNGEIVLGNKGHLMAASTAAGPAFEGARISQGMRATVGAIEKVVFEDAVKVNVIGNIPPVGLCGTALIDAAAEMLRLGIIEASGRLRSSGELTGKIPEKIAQRLVEEEGKIDFILVPAEETKNHRPILITQRDIRELQLAAGAIRAGTRILLKKYGLKEKKIGEVLIAGAFGNFIRRSNARRIGLLPDIPRERVRFVGNAASLGAKIALLNIKARERTEGIARKVKHTELAMDKNFQNEFAEAMIFTQ